MDDHALRYMHAAWSNRATDGVMTITAVAKYRNNSNGITVGTLHQVYLADNNRAFDGSGHFNPSCKEADP